MTLRAQTPKKRVVHNDLNGSTSPVYPKKVLDLSYLCCCCLGLLPSPISLQKIRLMHKLVVSNSFVK